MINSRHHSLNFAVSLAVKDLVHRAAAALLYWEQLVRE